MPRALGMPRRMARRARSESEALRPARSDAAVARPIWNECGPLRSASRPGPLTPQAKEGWNGGFRAQAWLDTLLTWDCGLRRAQSKLSGRAGAREMLSASPENGKSCLTCDKGHARLIHRLARQGVRPSGPAAGDPGVAGRFLPQSATRLCILRRDVVECPAQRSAIAKETSSVDGRVFLRV